MRIAELAAMKVREVQALADLMKTYNFETERLTVVFNESGVYVSNKGTGGMFDGPRYISIPYSEISALIEGLRKAL